MPITVDLATENLRTGTTSPNTWTHGGAGSGVKGVIIMIMHGTSNTDHVTAVSYGGSALSELQRNTDSSTEPGAAEIWFLGSSVPQGSQTASYTPGATTDDIQAVCITLLSSVDLYSIDVDGVNDNVANPSVTLTGETHRYAMAFAALYSGQTAISSLTAGSNCTAVGTGELAGNFTAQAFRQTTSAKGDFTIAVTVSTDDVAYAAAYIAERHLDFIMTTETATLTESMPMDFTMGTITENLTTSEEYSNGPSTVFSEDLTTSEDFYDTFGLNYTDDLITSEVLSDAFSGVFSDNLTTSEVVDTDLDTPTALLTRADKGSILTYAEMDANWNYLNDNKMERSVTTTASSATLTPNSTQSDFHVTALATNATFAAPTGTPTDGQTFTIRIKDNGTSRTLDWDEAYREVGVTLPTATTISKYHYVGLVYNDADNCWDVIAIATET